MVKFYVMLVVEPVVIGGCKEKLVSLGIIVLFVEMRCVFDHIVERIQ